VTISDELCGKIIELASEAGKIIMRYYRSDFQIIHKPDNSPVTTADLEANRFIVKELTKLTKDIEIISEEGFYGSQVASGDKFWLVDPLDGTRNFIKGNEHFAVSIGLVNNTQPVFGVIYLPIQQIVYFTNNNRAYKRHRDMHVEQISAKFKAQDGVDIVTSSSSDINKVKEFLAGYKVRNHYLISSAIKLCMVAEGTANLYPCFSQTMAWDTAGGHAILRAAGGDISLFYENKPLLYNKSNFVNPYFVAKGLEL
jgi:3'(2'), 5'-bisphosphate nucleotidase